MKVRTSIVTIVILFFTVSMNPCSCALKKLHELQELSINDSDCIFIGEIVETDRADYSFTIKVIESLDGNDEPNNLYVVKQFTTCDIFTDRKEKWIVYGTNTGNFITMSMCGLSRPIERPYAGSDFMMSPPVKDNVSNKDRKLVFKKFHTEQLALAKTKLKEEIEFLRKIRDE